MRVSINADERALAQTALDLGDKQCDTVRKGLETLHVEDLAVMALQGRIGELRLAFNDTKQRAHDWGFDERRALAICLLIYRDKLTRLVTTEAKLFVESRATEDKIGDLSDFIARLAGQELLFRAEDNDVEVRTAAEREPSSDRRTPVANQGNAAWESSGAPLSRTLATFAEADIERSRPRALAWLSSVASELERGEDRLTAAAYVLLVRAVLPRLAVALPTFDGTREGAYLLEELSGHDVNAIALASWIRAQLETPVHVSAAGVNEIRRALGKDPLEPTSREQRVLAENTPRNPLEVECEHCGVAPTKPCRSVSGKIVGSEPHMVRMRAAGATEPGLAQVANALYTDAVLVQVFGRADDELRTAVRKRRSIDLDATWVQTLLAGAPAGARAS